MKTKTIPASKPAASGEQHTTHFPLYKVLLHNDDRNSMEHVVKALMRVFKFEKRECDRIMMEAHRNGMALCVVEMLEQAEHHRDQLISLSLIASIEPD